MASNQICQNETSSIPSGRDEAISGVGMFSRVNGEEFPKFEEWYANANDIVAFFFMSGKKSGENRHEHTCTHHDHHPISIVFPLQLPNTIFILWFSLYRNKQIFITFLPPPLPSHVYWSVNTKQKRKPFYSEFFQKLKKRNLEPILSVLIHSLTKFKCKRNSIEPGLPGL